MTYNLYSVHDVKTTFAQPFMDLNDDSALRGFAFAYEQNSGLMSYAPADYRLYRIGQFDSLTGVLSPECPPVLVCDLSSLVRKDDVVEKQ